MAAKKVATLPGATLASGTAWEDAEVLTGAQVTDKAELVGVPFLMTGTKYTVNDRQVEMVWVEGERADGTAFTFNHSGTTGVKAQITEYLGARGVDTSILDTWVDIRLVAPLGLRRSDFEVMDERSKKLKPATSYYLTTNGQRA